MKKLILSTFIFISCLSAFAQDDETILTDTTWRYTGLTSLNFSQVYLKNWAAGGQQSLAGNALVDLSANYRKGKHSWENSLIMAYGVVKMGEADYQKSEDRIDLTSKYGREAFRENWFYTVLLNFKSQFAPGYNLPNDTTLISDFLSPGYGLLSFGLDHQPSESFSLYISPLTAKLTYVKNQQLADAGAFGVEPAEYNEEGVKTKDGEHMLLELGAYVKATFEKEIMTNTMYKTKLELFSSYTEDPTHIDVLWNNTLALKVNKYITANITTSLIYDHDIDIAVDNNDDGITDATGPRTQFMETFSLGIQYTFDKAK